MNLVLPQSIVFGFFLSFTLMGAEVFESEDVNAIFSAFKVRGDAAVSSCAQVGEGVYLTFSHMVDNEQLWKDFYQRKERFRQEHLTTQLPITQQHDQLPQSCLILTFDKQKTIIFEKKESMYRGRKVLGIHIINKIAALNAEKYTILAFTEDPEKLSLNLPKFHQFNHNLDFSCVANWKINFAMPFIAQATYLLELTFMHANSTSRSLFMHRTPISEQMSGGLIWNHDNQLVGMLVANLPTWKEHHSFDEHNISILQKVSTSFEFGFTQSKEHNDSFDITLNQVAVGQLISAQEIKQAFLEYIVMIQ